MNVINLVKQDVNTFKKDSDIATIAFMCLYVYNTCSS